MKTVTRRLLQKLPRDDGYSAANRFCFVRIIHFAAAFFWQVKQKIPSEMVEICLYFSWKTENIYDRIDTF